ncbi:hypothetical protein BD770DRAFT_306515, partial [Pilaira anomala]
IRLKEPDIYTGTRDALVIDSWIRSVERYSSFYKMDNEQSLAFATTLLRERADAWYSVIENGAERP